MSRPVAQGINSTSLNPDAAIKTAFVVAAAEAEELKQEAPAA